MAKARSGLSKTRYAAPQQQQPAPPTPIPAPISVPAPAPAQTVDKWGFKDTDDADFHELYNGRGYYQQQQFDIDTELAIMDYIAAQPAPGSVYSPSQQLNHAMKTGMPLTANQQFMKDSMMNGMHNLGYNLTLTRYARVDFVQDLSKIAGINLSGFSGMNASQLQQALVGKSFTEDGFISTSYNGFKNAPNGGAPFTDKAVKINYKAPAATQALMPGNGPGGALGEIVLGPNQKYTITGVRFTGKKGRSGAQMYNQIEFDITVG